MCHYSLIDDDRDCLSKYKTSNTQLAEGADSKGGFVHKILVQLHNRYEDFEELTEELTRRMTRKSRFLPLLPDHIHLDEMVVIQERRKWQKNILTQIRGAVVILRDWGRITMSNDYVTKFISFISLKRNFANWNGKRFLVRLL